MIYLFILFNYSDLSIHIIKLFRTDNFVAHYYKF